MPIQINLTPQDIGTNVFIEWLDSRGKYILLVFNIILISFYVYSLHLERQNLLISEEINRNHADIKKLQDKAVSFNNMQQTANYIKEERKKDSDPNFLLNFLSRATPSGIIIKTVSAQEGILDISAVSEDSIIFTSFIDLMVNEPRFKSVILTSSVYSESNDNFSSTFQITYE